MEYVLYKHYQRRVGKGQLPDVFKVYIAQTSAIGWHFDFTEDRKQAYIFYDFEWDEMLEWAHILQMRYEAI